MLVSFEGIDGSGKTTLVKAVQAELTSQNVKAVSFKEPTTGQFGKELISRSLLQRITPQEEVSLLIQDRIEDVALNILPALEAGNIVLMDRYYYSHVYQAARGLDLNWLIAENEKIAPPPQLVFILDLSVEEALIRMSSRKKLDSFETREHLEEVRRLFLSYVGRPNVVVVDASQSLQTVVAFCVAKIKECYTK